MLFSNEKKFTLDRPDNMRCSRKDKSAPKSVSETRHSGGGSVMVSAAFGYLWTTDKQLDVMEWPARSPDLTPIENL